MLNFYIGYFNAKLNIKTLFKGSIKTVLCTKGSNNITNQPSPRFIAPIREAQSIRLNYINKAAFILALLLVTLFSQAATRTSTATGGTWATGSTWVGGVAPAATDIVVIATTGGNSVTIGANTTCAGLTVNSGSILNFSGNRTLTVNTNATSVSGTINFSGSSTKTFNTDVTLTSGAVWNESAASAFTFAGNLTNNATSFTASTGVHTFSGNGETIGGTTITAIPSVTISGTITNTGTLTVSTTLAGASTLTNDATGILNFGGASITPTLVATASGNTVNYTGATQTVKVTTYSNLTLSGTGTKTFPAGTTTVNAVLSIENGANANTFTGTIAYGANATLQYNTSSARTAGAEWVSPFTASGGIIIRNTGAITMNSAEVMDCGDPLTISSGATLKTNNFQLTLGGDFVNGGTFTAGSSNIFINCAANQSIDGFTTTGTVSMTKTGGIATLQGNVNGGGFTINGAGGTLNLGSGYSHTFTGAISMQNGTLQGNSSTLNINGSITYSGGAWDPGTGTVNYNAAGAQNVLGASYYNLSFSGSGVKTMSVSTTILNNFSLSGTASTTAVEGLTVPADFTIGSGTSFSAGSFTHNIGGNWTKSGTFNANTSTIVLNGTTQLLTGATTFNNLTLGGSGTKTFSSTTATGNYTINTGVIANLGTGLTHTATTLSLGGAGEPSGSYGGTGSTATYKVATYFAPAVTGILNVTTKSCTAGSWTGLVSTDWNTGGNWCDGTVPTASTNVIINYGVNQPVIGAAGGVCNDITLNSGASLTISGSSALAVSGNWTNNGATFSAGTGTVTMNGAGGSTRTIGGTSATVFNNLTLGTDNAQHYLLGNSLVTINGVLNVTSNVLLTLGTYNLTLSTSASITPVASFYNGRMIVADGSGKLIKMINANGSFTFPIGDVTNGADYSPVALNFTAGTYAPGAYVAVNVTNAKHPLNQSPTNYLKRYWTVSQSGITSFTCNVTGTYVYSSDVVGGEYLQNAAEYTGLLPWVGFSALGSNTLTANGVTAFGDFTGMGMPNIGANTTSLTGFTYAHGNGPSGNQQITLHATNLFDNITITPPADFEVSLDNSTYSQTPLTLTQSGGVVNYVQVYMRLKAGLAVGTYANEVIAFSSPNASTVNLTVSGTVTPAGYCSAVGDNSAYSITQVNFNTINNSSAKPAPYSDYTSQSTNVLVGSTYPLTVNVNTNGNNQVFAKAWIDWNNDGDFVDAGESFDLGSVTNVANGKTSLCPLNITVPAGAVVGATRMRVACNYWQAVFGPCSGETGEVEDYTINIYNPAITGSAATLNGLTYVVGSGPSAEQSFAVVGSGLVDNITVTPPVSNFEISTLSGGVFQSTPITLTQVGGNVNATVYVRLKQGLVVGGYGPLNITLSSTSATSKTVACSGTVVPSVTVGGGGSYCAGSTINLTSSGSGLSNLYWTGPNSFYSLLANPTITSATTAMSGLYAVTANYVDNSVNLIANGNFESGRTGFSSDYIYRDSTYNDGTGYGALGKEGVYSVVALPKSVHTNFGSWPDHSNPGKFQMVINGATAAGVNIWYETVPVVPNTNYQFSYWVQSVGSGTDAAPSQLQLYVTNDQSVQTPIGSIYTANATGGVWTQFFYNWNSGSSTTALLALVNKQTAAGGNDFALDDIVFQPVYTVSSSVNVSVIATSSPASVSVSASANPVNMGTNVTFTATPTNGGTAPTYQWYVNDIAVSGATNPVYSYVPAVNDVVKCVMTSNSACLSSTNPVSASVAMNVITIPNYWKGTNGTNWGTASNWTAGFVPATGDDVTFATASTSYGDATNDLVLDVDRTIGNLTNQSTKRLIVAPAKCLTVNGSITTNGASSPGSIYIQAYPNGSQQNGSLIFPNASNVYATVEMYSKATHDNTGVTASNGTTYFYSWQYFGVPITSVVADPTFYGSFVRAYDESSSVVNGKWTALTNSSVLTPFKGYEITQDAPATIYFQGQLVNRDTTINLPYTLTAYDPGQSIFSNPYAAAINISKLNFGANTESTVYLYNTGSFGSWMNNAGEATYSNSSTTPGQYIAIPQNVAGTGGIPYDIPSMSGFLVKNTGGGVGSLTISYNTVITKNVSAQRVLQSKVASDKQYMEISLRGEHYGDCMWLINQSGTTRGFDNGWDGYKLAGAAGTPRIFAMEESGNYQISTSEDISNTYLGFQAGVDAEDTLTFVHENLETKYNSIYLADLVENKVIDITKPGTQYVFKTEAAKAPVRRFKIITGAQIQKIDTLTSRLKVFNDDNAFFVDNSSNEEGVIYFYDVMGRYLKKEVFGANQISVFRLFSTSGIYMAKAVLGTETVTKQFIVKYQGD